MFPLQNLALEKDTQKRTFYQNNKYINRTHISMDESNTIVSAYTLYRHLQ